MKNLRIKLKEKLIAYRNKKARTIFFNHIKSDEFYMIKDRKLHYEMLFNDGAVTTLPKNLFSFIKRWSETDQPSLRIGRGTYLQNLKLDILLDQKVSIGSFCSFGPNVVIKPDGVRGKVQFTTYPLDLIDASSKIYIDYLDEIRSAYVTIGNDCFIGEDVKIMANVVINDGVIIGERSLVTSGKVLEAFGIYAGIPARLIGYRYNPNIIVELLRIQWWNWPISKIRESGLQDIDFLDKPDETLQILKAI